MYTALREALAGSELPVFYLATPPSMFDEIAERARTCRPRRECEPTRRREAVRDRPRFRA